MVRGVGKFEVRALVDSEVVAEANLLAAMRADPSAGAGGS
jgi:3-hydroxymyristoyl/3-hydroxydecanoyl-(acyl carrier protein) dehydratase